MQAGRLLGGLALSNDATLPNTVLDISKGVAVDSTASFFIKLPAFTKSISATWVAGSGNGGMGAGLTVAASTWYHVFLIMDSGSADIYFDTSVTAANAPSGTTAFRRIGSFMTNASSQITAFSQNDDEFLWGGPVNDFTTTLTTTSALFVLSVPTGVKVNALFNAGSAGGADISALFSSGDLAVQTVGLPAGNDSYTISSAAAAAGQYNVRTNTSAQIRAVASASITISEATTGWVDTRGRFN
jgi:hypothetical protein